MNKLSFKTTTLIAAIGMSIAAIFFLAEFAMGRTLSMAYLTIFSMPERIARHVFFAIQLLSAAIFFFGAYRFPNQMPKRNEENAGICERMDDSFQRIREFSKEQSVPAPYRDYFLACASFADSLEKFLAAFQEEDIE